MRHTYSRVVVELLCLSTELVSSPLSCDWTVNVAGGERKCRKIAAHSFRIHFPFSARVHRTRRCSRCKHATAPVNPATMNLSSVLLVCINKDKAGLFYSSPAASPKTQAVIAGQPLRCLSELHTCRKEKPWPLIALCYLYRAAGGEHSASGLPARRITFIFFFQIFIG